MKNVNKTNPSLKLNMVLNAIKGIMGVLFPLITFPYITRILGVENVGRYNFANTIISYLVLFAGLGISTYAVREGSRIRNKYGKIEHFLGQMFSINIFSTIISYIILAILLVAVPKFTDYRALLIILSIQIAFKTFGIEWLYSIYEDYLYIAIRSILFQVISLVLLFCLVKNSEDLNVYAGITVFSAVGSNILNYIHSRKYCRVKITLDLDLKKHIKPILILFAMVLTVSIYVSSDTTMLGFLCNDYTVGIYSVSTKVYTIVKTVLSSVLVVSIPRLSLLLGNNLKTEFDEVASDIYRTLLTVVFPSITGLILLSKEIVLLISTSDYIAATLSLSILSVALFFCLGAWFWGQCILVPVKKERDVFNVTVVSAIVNICLNFILIPVWKENAAAITTIVAEAITFGWSWYKGKKYVQIKEGLSTFLKVLVGCVGIVMISLLVRCCISGIYMVIIVSIVSSVLIYSVIEILLRNKAATAIIQSLKRKM